jgi:hypothetical protein
VRLNTAQPPPLKTAILSTFTIYHTPTLTTVSAQSIPLHKSVKCLSSTVVVDSAPYLREISTARLFSAASVVWWLARCPLVPKIAGSNPAKDFGFFGRKNPQHASLRRGSKAVCLMSQICGMLKKPAITWKSDCLVKFDRSFLAHNSSFR